jgi:hypothetical protein
MKKLVFLCGVALLAISVSGMISPVYAQFDNEVQDLSNLLNGAGGGNNRGNNNRNIQIPDSKVMFEEIKKTLKDGKTPLESAQEKPLKSLLDTEIVALSDKIQLMRNNQNGNNQTAANNTGGRGGQPGNNPQQNQQPNETAIKVDTITGLKNDEFLATKIALFLSPEQVALVQKARADDKANSNCLGGLLDRYYQQMQSSNNNRGNNQNFNNNNNNNNNNNQTRPNGQKYCMTTQVTPSERLEPMRKVLSKGNMPLGKDKEVIAEAMMKAELKDLEDALRAGLTSGNNNNNNRGNNNNNNRNNDPRQVIQSTKDGLYKKVQAMLKPEQAATMKRWHYTEMLGRTPIDSLIAVNAMQDTPLTDEQIAKVTAAWPELRNQIQQLAKQAGKQVDAKTVDAAAMAKILDMLEPSQVASYQLAKKYGPEAAAGK